MERRTVVVCPTSHLDWDWLDTFGEYERVGPPDANQYTGPTDSILTGVADLLASHRTFRFSLAEVGFLRAFVERHPHRLEQLLDERLELMGGGITSPDNLICHGEVFIRNYLLGRAWLASVGLSANVGPVAWLPDDFGHDPQLPVVLAAMGLEYVGVSRVPGSIQPFATQPLDGGKSVAQQLMDEGLVFQWVASDGSQVLAHFMPDKYAAFWAGGSPTPWTFVDDFATGWPEVAGQPLLLVTAGGDFARARWKDGTWLTSLAHNQPPAGFAVELGTFDTFMRQAAPVVCARQEPLLAQNFY